MKEFFATIRGECSATTWSRGVALARAGAVVGEREDEEEVVLKVAIPGKTASPTVSLFIEDEDWSCDCGGRVDPCEHVAAA
ncbi:MAG: SWIM zinc finger family protein, partial [Deltaproteobacteria bacterium]|nr:SWIM zinc finger family protein [Deltaproteobacteria bacterium]